METEVVESQRPGTACPLCGELHGVTGLSCKMRHPATPGFIEFKGRIWEEAPEWATALGKLFKRAIWVSDTHYKYPDDPMVYELDDYTRQYLVITERR